MELIKALEQLSLEVRNQCTNISTRDNNFYQGSYQQATNNETTALQQQITTTDESSKNERYFQHYSMPTLTDVHQHQLREFDNSIETLFTQISDLDCLKPVPIQRRPNSALDRRDNFRCNPSWYQPSRNPAGSMETSQEEDSDCSSQQSGSASNRQSNSEQVCINPLVKDLLKRDLGAITDTVRKIGRILALGSEIETLHNNLFNSDQKINTIDTSYTRSMCDAFESLCLSEPHIKDLPTIIRYEDYCHRLLAQLNKLNHSLPSNNCEYEMTDNQTASVDEEEDDIDFLSCDQSRLVNNWTENKLYINHENKFN